MGIEFFRLSQIFPRLYVDTEIITRNECYRANSSLQMSQKLSYLSHTKRAITNWTHWLHIPICLLTTKRKYLQHFAAFSNSFFLHPNLKGEEID